VAASLGVSFVPIADRGNFDRFSQFELDWENDSKGVSFGGW
jgi:hypothetical protein